MREDVRKGYEEGNWPDELGNDRDLREYEDSLLNQLLTKLPEKPDVLDLGCGTGLPFDKWLAEQGCNITGIDIVEQHLEKARQHIPDGEFRQADFSQVDYTSLFDAVVSFYAIFHIPREEHAELFEMMHQWLRPNGWILITIAAGDMERHHSDFVGGEMVWSSYSPDKTIDLLREAGFRIENTYEEHREDAGEHHIWVLAQ